MSTSVTGHRLCQKRRTFTLQRGTYLWVVMASVIAISINNAVMIKDTGTFYRGTSVDNADYPFNHSTVYDFNVIIHKCSMSSNCNYVIFDKKAYTLKMYENERDIQFDDRLQQVWMKQPRKHKYMVVTEKLNWQDARQRCQEYFGDLASITSKQEEELYAKVLVGFSYAEEFWIGLNDIDNEGKFVWSDGRNYNYTSWSDGEPNNYLDEDCTILSRSLKWNDGLCHYRFYSICRVPVA